MYLIDSISKNVGAPYTDSLLPPIMPRLYLRAYREVDGVTKSKMEEMLKLWRTGGPGGTELYPSGVREEVERGIFGSALPAPIASSPPPIATPPQQLTQQSVQATLRAFLREKEDEMAQEFSMARAKRVDVLVKIDQLLASSQVSPTELADIMEKIRAMQAGKEPGAAPAPRPPAPVQQPGFQPRAVGAQPNYGNQPAPYTQPTPTYPPFGVQPPPASYRSPLGAGAVPTPPPAPVPLAVPGNLNVADILKNLSGVLSHTHTPEPVGSTTPKDSLQVYEDMILALNMKVDVFDLSKLSLPVSHLPVRCKQCGMRFVEGENTLQAHMDWHFRRNRKERETEGRGAHRRWLPRASEWINESSEAGPSTPVKQEATLANPNKLTAERIAALRRKWVRAPSDPNNAPPCPICKDQFKPEFSEDEEEWVFMNAIDVHGTIYHATCRAEKMSAVVAQRLLANEPRGGSASPGPVAEDVPSPGTKRKAENESDAASEGKRVKVQEDVKPDVSAIVHAAIAAQPDDAETVIKMEPAVNANGDVEPDVV